MHLINLTPHGVTVYIDGKPAVTFPPSGQIARLEDETEPLSYLEADRPDRPDNPSGYGDVYVQIPLTALRSPRDGRQPRITGLPPAERPWSHKGEDGRATGPDHYRTGYIVSRLVAEACPREDLFIPGAEVRDDAGRIIGCDGLRVVC